MQIPTPPSPQPIQAVSPSLYEALRSCKAKALWTRHGNRQTIPETPNSLLGTSFHKAMEVAALGQLPKDPLAALAAARLAFDHEAQRTFDAAHPLLRNKYPTKEHLPNYFLQRERAALAAAGIAPSFRTQGPATPGSTPQAAPAPEQTFVSTDAKLKGKIDLLKPAEREVVDYKAGIVLPGQGSEVSDRERRQLTFYAYLAQERGYPVQKGTIVRSNGTVCSIDIAHQDATALAEQARNTLREFNLAIESGKTFPDLAQPSKEACWFCPCIPFCELFWQAQNTGWTEYQGFGWHIEGTVNRISTSELQGLTIITMTLCPARGTDIPEGASVTIEQVPSTWITADPTTIPKQGDLVRIVHARRAHADNSVLFRADKALSTIWHSSPQTARDQPLQP
jgi:hypothetical protein